MAKKTSAKSKGYRKTVEKKPYLTKKEITITVCVIAALILAFVLFNILYDDGSLKIRNGKLQVSENSLILNTGSSKHPAYYKIGQIADIEGYTMDSHPQGTDEHDLEYVFYLITLCERAIGYFVVYFLYILSVGGAHILYFNIKGSR